MALRENQQDKKILLWSPEKKACISGEKEKDKGAENVLVLEKESPRRDFYAKILKVNISQGCDL